MTTVPHPTPASYAMAALYGTEDDTLIAWQRGAASTTPSGCVRGLLWRKTAPSP